MKLVTFPDPVLRKKSEPVPAMTDGVRDALRSMHDVMVANEGIGLAAPQVGLSLRMCVVDLRAGAGPVWAINPVVTPVGLTTSSMREGCLSVPGAWGDVERPAIVRLDYSDWRGSPMTMICSGLLSAAVQHENDHLDGILHLDRMKSKDMLAAIRESCPSSDRLPAVR